MKSVLVSGASKGIGLATAILLANSGYRVYAGVRTDDSKSEIEALGYDSITPVILDVTSEKTIEAARQFILDESDGLDGLINNAGSALLGPVEFLPLSKIRDQFDVNLFGHIKMVQVFLPLIRSRKGRIVNISSISGFNGFPYFSAYSSSKYALEGFNESLRRELRSQGIKVAIVSPGNVDTNIWNSTFWKGKEVEETFPKEAYKLYGRRFVGNSSDKFGPAKKAKPEEVANCVLHALSSSNPKIRYLVGRDAHKLYWMKKILPVNLVEAMLS